MADCDIPACPYEGVKAVEVPGGCIALPGVETQTLCLQHLTSCEPLDE